MSTKYQHAQDEAVLNFRHRPGGLGIAAVLVRVIISAPARGAPPQGRRRQMFWTYVRKLTQNVRLIRSSYPMAGVSQTGLECHAKNKETSTDRYAAAQNCMHTINN